MTIRNPVGGVVKRTAYQEQPDYTAYAASNVWPDNVTDGRQRLGVRPGLTTAVSGTLPGPIRMLHEINVQTATGTESVLVCSAGGNFYRRNASTGQWGTAISTSYSLATDKLIQAAVFGQKLYIADYGIDASGTTLKVSEATNTIVHLPEIVSDTNGTTDGAGTIFHAEVDAGTNGALDATGLTFTSSGATFVTNGVTTAHLLRLTDAGSGGATPGVYAISSVDSETQLTLSTSAGTTASGIDFEVDLDFAAAGVTTSHYLRVLSTGDTTTATIDAYVISAVNQDQLTLSTAASSGAETGISFEIRPAMDTDVTSEDHGLEVLEAGAGTAGFYPISTVEEDQWTLTTSPGTVGTTGIHFRAHRVPKVWDLSNDSITKWTATAGTVPLSCPVIAYFQDRIVLAGAPEYPNIWYASAQGEPTDFDYDGDDAGTAVSGTTFTNGKIGDPITALIPHNRQCLVIGAEDSLYVMRGDPASPSATIDQLSAHLGPLSPQAWCKDAEFHTWMLTRDGLYRMNSGCGDTPLSFSREKLPDALLNVDARDYVPQLKYDLLQRSVHVYVPMRTVGASVTDGVGSSTSFTSATLTDWSVYNVQVGDYLYVTSHSGSGSVSITLEITAVSGGTLTLEDDTLDALTNITASVLSESGGTNTAYWVDTERGGIWPMDYDDDVYPSSLCEYGELTSSDKSSVILGGVDGVARQHDRSVTTDAGSAFTGSVTIGPFPLTRDRMGRGMITAARLVPTNSTSSLSWEIAASNTPEAAARELPTTVPVSGDPNYYTNMEQTQTRLYALSAGYLQTQWPRIAGAAGVITVYGTGAGAWGVESIELQVAEAGRLR